MSSPVAAAAPLFTVDQYHRMIESGVLNEGDAVELIEGQIIHKGQWREDGPVLYRFAPEQCLQMVSEGILSEDEAFTLAELGVPSDMPRSPAHDSAIDRMDDALGPLLPGTWRLRVQSAIRLASGEPEPDLAVVLGPAGRYDDHHPEPSEIGMLVEVADSTLAYDQNLKLRAYARANIPVYWIVNLIDEQVEVYTDPESPAGADPRYRTHTDYGRSQAVPVVVAGTSVGSVSVDSVLPRP